MSSLQWYNERTREQLRREIGWTIANRVRDPRIPSLVTVTDLKLAPDMRNATVFVSVYGDEQVRHSALTALNKAVPFIQKVVAERVSMKHFPRFIFKPDKSMDYGERIDELLNRIKDDLE